MEKPVLNDFGMWITARAGPVGAGGKYFGKMRKTIDFYGLTALLRKTSIAATRK
jgi:hypothetical protein